MGLTFLEGNPVLMSAGGSRVREAGQRLRHADQAVGFEHMLEPATIGGSPM